MTVREMLGRIGADELDRWAAYEKVHGPLGGARDDVLAAMVTAAVYNSRRTRSSDPLIKPVDVIPQWDGKPRQTWQEQKAIAQQLAATFGGTFTDTDTDEADTDE